MLKIDGVSNLIESYKNTISNDRVANLRAAKRFGELIEKDKIDEKEVSFKALMEGSLRAEGLDSIPSDEKELKEAVSSSAFPTLSNEVISTIAIPEFQKREEGLSDLYTEYETSDFQGEKLEGLTGTEGVKQVAPQEPYESSTFGEKTASIDVNKYGRTIELPMELVMADKNDRIRNKAAEIGEKFGQQFERHLIETLEIRTRSLIENESTSRAAVFNDNVISQSDFYSDDHSSVTGLDGQTNDNLATSGDAISLTGLKSGYSLFGDMVDEEGDNIVVSPKIMVVNTADEVDVWELLNTVQEPGSNNNTRNYFGPNGAKSLSVISTPYLSSSGIYYMGDPKKQLAVVYAIRPNVSTMGTDSEAAYRRDIVASYKFQVGFGVGQKDYRYIVKHS